MVKFAGNQYIMKPLRLGTKCFFARRRIAREVPGIIEKQAEDPLPLGGGMNTVPTAIELEAK
jgi:hypothetical protein